MATTWTTSILLTCPTFLTCRSISDLNIDAVEYSRIMHRIGIDGDETVTRVSAFNSSI